MEHKSSSEANSSSASQKIRLILWNPDVQYGVHKRPSLAPTLSQTNPAHALTTYSLNIHFNIILLPKPRAS